MDLPLNKDLLYGRWVRVQKSGTEKVFRPMDYPDLPASREIEGYEFKADGTFKRLGSAPNDVGQVSEGTWQLDPAHPDQIRVEIDGQEEILKIQDLEADRLTIQNNP